MGTKLSALAAATSIADGDLFAVVDVSDTSMAGTGTTKYATAAVVKAMIKGEKVYSYPGTLVAGTGTARIYFTRAVTLYNVAVSVATPPTGDTILVDVNKNGTTVFTTQGNRPTIAISGYNDLTAVPDVTAIAGGDYLTVDIDQIGSSTAGADLVVIIEYTEG